MYPKRQSLSQNLRLLNATPVLLQVLTVRQARTEGFLSRVRRSCAQNLRQLQETSVLCTKTSVPQAYVCLSMQDRRHLNIFPSLMYADPRRFDGYAGPRHCTDVRLTET